MAKHVRAVNFSSAITMALNAHGFLGYCQWTLKRTRAMKNVMDKDCNV